MHRWSRAAVLAQPAAALPCKRRGAHPIAARLSAVARAQAATQAHSPGRACPISTHASSATKDTLHTRAGRRVGGSVRASLTHAAKRPQPLARIAHCKMQTGAAPAMPPGDGTHAGSPLAGTTSGAPTCCCGPRGRKSGRPPPPQKSRSAGCIRGGRGARCPSACPPAPGQPPVGCGHGHSRKPSIRSGGRQACAGYAGMQTWRQHAPRIRAAAWMCTFLQPGHADWSCPAHPGSQEVCPCGTQRRGRGGRQHAAQRQRQPHKTIARELKEFPHWAWHAASRAEQRV